MPTCILHVGMPKTGTSSIQESLHIGLRDPRFRSVHLGHANAVWFLEALFGDDPDAFWVYRRAGLTGADLRRLQIQYNKRLRRVLRRARLEGVTPIISAERCWAAPALMLERIRSFLQEEGFDVHVIAYIRPMYSWIESYYQQIIKGRNKYNIARLPEVVLANPNLDISGRLECLYRIFGASSVRVRLFAGHALIGGCAVRDFCNTLGIDLDDRAIVRANESICVDAVRMMYCFGSFSTGPSVLSLRANRLLIMKLQGLKGERFRLHPSLLAALAGEISRQEREVFARCKIDLCEEPPALHEASAIRTEADMFRFSRASLDWLARYSGKHPIATCEGEATARAVAGQIAALARRPHPGLWLRFQHDRLRLKWRSLRQGD